MPTQSRITHLRFPPMLSKWSFQSSFRYQPENTMNKIPLWDHIPEIFVALSYYPCGAFLAFLLHSWTTISITLREYSFIWALLFGILGAFIASFCLTISKHVARRIVWIHYYLLALGSVLTLTAGIVCISNQLGVGYESTTYVGGIGYGIIYISGMAYIHVRTHSRKHRLARIGLCHLAMAIGVVTTTANYAMYPRYRYPRYLRNMGFFMIYSSASVLACFLLNELLHGLGGYNYKMCLDAELRAADERRDRMKNALCSRTTTKKFGRRLELVAFTILSKAMNGFINNNIFLFVAILAQDRLVSNEHPPRMTPHFFAISGVFVGMIASFWVKIKVWYPVALIGKFACITLAAILWENSKFVASGVFFWFFYLVSGSGLYVPDAAIMEVGHPMTYELNMFCGFFLEQIPMIVSIYFVREEFLTLIWSSSPLWTFVGFTIALSVILALWYALRYPDTKHLTVLEIQRMVLFNHARPVQRIVEAAPPSTIQGAPTAAPVFMASPMTYGAAPQIFHQPPPQFQTVNPSIYASGASTVMPLPPLPVAGASTAAQPYLLSQPLFPGHQPVYLVHPSFYPEQIAAFNPDFGSAAKADAASAPELTPRTETEQVQWVIQHQLDQLPPSYEASQR